MKARYYVCYGNSVSRQACRTLAEVNAFIAYCLREGTPITRVCKAGGAA